MGLAMQVLSGFVTAPSTTFTALTMGSGDSLTVRNHPRGRGWLLNAWADSQTAGNLRILSAQMHDNVQGIRLFSVASEVAPLMTPGLKVPLEPFDTMVVSLTGSATSADIESACLLMFYEDAHGFDARLLTWAQVKPRIIDVFTVENTLALGTGGGYSGEEAINAEFDQFKSNFDYALLGYTVSAECAMVGWRAPDTSNLRVGGPGNELRKELTAGWFKYLSEEYQIPAIPIFNANNKGGILIDGVQDENGTDTTVTSIFARLRM